jgi:polar amino acid transport system permease protein
MNNINLEPIIRYMPLIIKGAFFTIYISALSLFIGTLLGLILAVFQTSKVWILRIFANIYTLFIRSIPLLLLLFLMYYLPSILFKAHTSKFLVAILSLSLFSSAYAAEIIRSGFLSIPKVQTESGLSLGLTKLQVIRFIIFPQTLKTIIPPYIGLYTVVIKDSSLVSIIGYFELTRVIRLGVMNTYASFELYTFALLVYFLICYPLSLISKIAEAKTRS